MPTVILGIESSCDDTAASVLVDGEIRSNVVAGQELHQLYGGIVPEYASRAHQEHIIPVVDAALKKASVPKKDLNAVAVTLGPGLMGSLIVGVSFAKALAMSLNIPLIEVHHLEAHVWAHLIDPPRPVFPFLCLTVSGGHTQIVRVESEARMTVLGKTLDDAAGEAFDKSGKLMGLPYPAGPQIDRLAQKGTARFTFPEPRISGLDFSFSGLKTSILYFLRKEKAKDPDFISQNLNDLCASIQKTIVSILMHKLIQASEQESIREIAIAGGVSANSALRQALEEAGQERDWQTYVPTLEYCTDNAAMIAMAGYIKYKKGQFSSLDIAPKARWAM
jgi:N6-L-threonylcarbamoyladenine synthase